MLDAFVFFPDRHVPAAPAGIEDRWITTADGVRLHAWWGGPPDPVATLLWSHGNAGNIADRVDVLRAFVARGLGVLAYDYRGYGRSDGRPSEAGVSRDAEAAFDALVAAGVPSIVPGPGAGGEPDLLGGGLPVQHEARAVVELDGDQPVAREDVEVLEVAQPAPRTVEARLRRLQVLPLVHTATVAAGPA